MTLIDLTLSPGQLVELDVTPPPSIELEVSTVNLPGPPGPPGEINTGGMIIPGIIIHGYDETIVRPSVDDFPVIIWIGYVFPPNSINNDIFLKLPLPE